MSTRTCRGDIFENPGRNDREIKSGAMSDHETYMKMALALAEIAGDRGEVPVGAVLTAETGEVLASAFNQPISLCDPTAHAEILALREGARGLENYRLLNTTLYVTIEPCLMCMGAIIHARVKRVVFGARDPRWGAAGSLYNFAENNRLNHRPEIVAGVCESACRQLIQSFFSARR
jgi:tRNA(adenine34) deaminase